MFVCRFGVEDSDDFAIVKSDADIEKGYGCERIITCKFHCGVNIIEQIEKGSECIEVLY